MRVLVYALLTLLAANAQAQPSSAPSKLETQLNRLEDQILHASYEEALEGLEALLEKETLTASLHLRILELVAVAQIATRQQKRARRTLLELFRRDPGHRLNDPDASPVVMGAFARAREDRKRTANVTIKLENVRYVGDAKQPELRVAVEGQADAVDALQVAFRRRGDRHFVRLRMNRPTPERALAVLPASTHRLESEMYEYYIEARAPSSWVLARLGSPDGLRTVSIPPTDIAVAVDPTPTDQQPLWGRWWFWSAVAGVVGSAVAGYVLLGPPSESATSGSLGQARLK